MVAYTCASVDTYKQGEPGKCILLETSALLQLDKFFLAVKLMANGIMHT